MGEWHNINFKTMGLTWRPQFALTNYKDVLTGNIRRKEYFAFAHETEIVEIFNSQEGPFGYTI